MIGQKFIKSKYSEYVLRFNTFIQDYLAKVEDEIKSKIHVTEKRREDVTVVLNNKTIPIKDTFKNHQYI